MNDQKLENLLNLALDATDAEREKSLNMNFGYDRQNRIWELIVRYHGDLSGVGERTKEIILLSGGYAIITAEESEIDWISSQPEVEYIEKPKRLFFSEAGYRIVPSRDLSGHGTEVLGIAAGNGQASGGQYRGVASKSDILVVKIGTAGSEFAGTVELMLALDYVIRKAMELGKPVAINLSFGNVYGSHVPYTRGILGLNRS